MRKQTPAPPGTVSDEITHYEEYADGVYRREVSLEEHRELSDYEFQTKRYLPVYWGSSLTVTKLPNDKLKVEYESIDWEADSALPEV